tara:strand:+ start:542 stop:898 length:357 start_codon:yes stop_codon:yes gene_type:complete
MTIKENNDNNQTELLGSINEKLDKLLELLSINNKLDKIIQILNNTTNSLVIPEDVYWSSYKKSIIVYGNTRPFKEHIKKAGGKWNSKLTGWIFYKPKFQSWNPGIKNVEKEFSSSDSE